MEIVVIRDDWRPRQARLHQRVAHVRRHEHVAGGDQSRQVIKVERAEQLQVLGHTQLGGAGPHFSFERSRPRAHQNDVGNSSLDERETFHQVERELVRVEPTHIAQQRTSPQTVALPQLWRCLRGRVGLVGEHPRGHRACVHRSVANGELAVVLAVGQHEVGVPQHPAPDRTLQAARRVHGPERLFAEHRPVPIVVASDDHGVRQPQESTRQRRVQALQVGIRGGDHRGSAAGQKRQQPEQEGDLTPDHLRQAQALGTSARQAEVDVDQVVTRREIECATAAGGEMDVPHLLEVPAEVAALALEEQVDTVARKDLRDLARAQIHNAPRPTPPAHAPQRGRERRQHRHAQDGHQCREQRVQQPYHSPAASSVSKCLPGIRACMSS